MCILLKLYYAKFDVSKENPLGERLDPTLIKEGLRTERNYHTPADIKG